MFLIAHAGAGATWQAMVTLVSFGLVGVLLGVVTGRIRLDEPGDLVLPVAATAVLASLSGATNAFLSDWIGWWAPIGAVALVAIALHTFTAVELTPRSPVTIASAVIAIVAAVALHTPLEDAWHPVVTGMQRDDVAIEITTPKDGSDIPLGATTVTVEVTGGTIGANSTSSRPDDPEEAGIVHVFVDGILATNDASRPLPPREDCSDLCTTATWDIDLDRGSHVISVEFLSANLESFTTTVAGSPTVDLVAVQAQ